MKSMNASCLQGLALALILLAASPVAADEKPATSSAINGVQGVKQENVESIKKVEPPTANADAISTAQGVNKVDGVNTIDGVKAAGRDAVQPLPPKPAGSAASVGGGAVGAVSSIRAVQGVQGIVAPKQLNLEAALLIKDGGGGTPAGGGGEGGKGKAAAAALLTAPAGQVPAKPIPGGDGRALFQEFEKLTTPGS